MKNCYYPKCIILILNFLLLSSNLTFGANGKLTGRITDAQTREPLPGVNVVITHIIISGNEKIPLDQPIGSSTDLDGYYFILNVPPGTYSVRASLVGYQSLTQENVKVDLDRTINLDFQLGTTVIEVEQVVVTAENKLVKQDVSATQEIIVTERLEQMPFVRLDEFVGSLKGVEVVSGAQGHGLSFRGGAIRETDIRIDGISLQDPRTENSYLALNSTSIKEIQVLTGGFQAKYGGIRSGLLNVVTKEGQRERYTVSLKFDTAPKNQKRFFGTSPWSNDSWIYKVYAGQYAFRGVAENDTTVPLEFRGFKGWAFNYRDQILGPLDSLQRYELWKAQHPQYSIADNQDYYIEGSITGPFPGSFIPFFGDFAERTTFLIGFKYENTQLAFPIGPRKNYLDWNGQIKLTTHIQNNMKLSVNVLYAKIETVSGGRAANYGGALVDQASSFSFLNTTESSVRQAAGLIGTANWNQIFNLSRLQFYDQKYIIGGAKFTHTIAENAFYDLDFQVGFTDQSLKPFAMDTSIASNYVYFHSTRTNRDYRFLVPTFGSPNASTNFGFDALNIYTLYGGPQRVDSSSSYVYQLKGDLTAQFGRHHQVEAGFSARLQDLFVYAGTWFQSELAFTPDTWQYYSATPLEIGLYLQDKIEFEGMILNAGLRLDYLNPMKKGFNASHPLDEDYVRLYNELYGELPGDPQSYERWVEFRSLLENPTGWPQTENDHQFYLSPRLGVSFPITESSKLYFNYGHFYQKPPIPFMYNLTVVSGGVQIPTPSLKMAQTVSYEFGYEQMFLNDFLVNVTAYYKDVKNEPLARTYINYFEDIKVTEYVPDSYRDIRGVELRLERPIGRFITFNAMYDYMLQSSGQSGLSAVYENRLKASLEGRSANISITEPRPRANVNLNLHTPRDFGPEWAGIHWLGEFYANFFFEWQDGGSFLLNPEAEQKDHIYIDVVDYWNIDFRASKAFTTPFGSIEFVLTIKNLTNNKFLVPGNMTQTQFDEYKQSLRTPDKGGDDKWGEFHDPGNLTGSDKPHIKTGWYEAPIFLNPQRIILGLRLNI
jgi:hypothetical protein